jgi:predicted flap endonuclease-1-like 5' DNA nuclease
MISLFQLSTCDIGIFPLILGTLIPFLLGLLLGWIIWAKWKNRFEDLLEEHNNLKVEFAKLTEERDEWISKHDQVASDLSISESNVMRLKLESKELKASRNELKLNLEQLQASLVGGNESADRVLTDADLKQAAQIFGKKIKLNDLTLIEGIGPKIAGLLNDAGIDSWQKLSHTSVDLIKSILEKNALGFHTPKTWPRQAELAANGKWEELLKWQDELDGGK